MGEKTAGVGHFAIPTAPAAGTSCTSGAANTFTTTYVQLIASTAAALYITGIFVEAAAALGGTYDVVQLATGGAGSETIVGQYLINLSTGSTTATGYRPIYPPIPVAISTRIACKTADSVGAKATLITLECIAQSNVVDDGVGVTLAASQHVIVDSGTVTTVTNQLTAAAIATGVWQDAVAGDFTVASSIGKSLYTGNVAPGGANGLFIAGTNAATTITTGLTTTFTGNLTGSVGSVTGAVGSVTGAVGSVTGAVGSVTGAVGSVTAGVSLAASQHVIVDSGTVTTLTNLPSIPAAWLTATGIAATALNGKGDWPVGKTGYSLTTSDWAKAGDAMTLTAAYDAAKTALTVGGYTAPDNASVTAIKAKTDSLNFTVPGKADANILVINGVTVTGVGTSGTPWGPA